MSHQAARDFIDSLTSDSALAQKAAALKGSAQDITQLAHEHGYEFTPHDLEAVLPMPTDPPNRELTDEELDMAVGGAWSGYWTWNTSAQPPAWVWTWVWYPDSSGWVVS